MESNIINDILHAIDKGEIKAYFQPQVDAVTKKVTGAEALVRWVKPDGTIVPPMDFIPELEKSIAITNVDWCVAEQTCMLLRDHAEELAGKTISINFSRWHIKEADPAQRLYELCNKYGVDPSSIDVEITESAMIEEYDGFINLINRFHAKGFKIAIDDFGTGLSSLHFIKDIPIDVLKLDKSLISSNCEDRTERILLESIINFASRLNFVTISEGVETKEQLAFLEAIGSNRIQGFLFSKPLAKDSFLQFIAEDALCDEADILTNQSTTSAQQLLLQAIFMKYPLVIFSNLTKNSFYMMAYESFTTTHCPDAGAFTDLIAHGTLTMHPEDRESFSTVFSRENLLKAHSEGKQSVRLVTRQLGDDGIYRHVETTDFFVSNPSSSDVLVISLCTPIE